MRSSTPLTAAVVLLALAVAFLIWERNYGIPLRNGSTIDAATAASTTDTAASVKMPSQQGKNAGAPARPTQALGQPVAVPGSSALPPSPIPDLPGALERSLIDLQHMALTANASRLILSPKFDAYAAKLQADADADAVNRVRDYRDLFDETLAALPGAKSVNRLACGVNLCMASIVAGKEWTDFLNWQMSLQGLSDLPMGASAVDWVDRPGGDVEYRMIFTTSRELNAIQGDFRQP